MNASQSETATDGTARGCHFWRQSYRPAPFSDDPEAVEERARCDYNIKITRRQAETGTALRPVRVYSEGTFDLFHHGHAKQLMQAKNYFPNVYLIVGVNSDEDTWKRKGKTVMLEQERFEAVRHCRYVDEVLPKAPWTTDQCVLEKHKIDFVTHDAVSYPEQVIPDPYGVPRRLGIFIPTLRTEGISTADLITRVLRDYDAFVKRNLDRGYSARELNISYLKEKKYQLQSKMDELKDVGKMLTASLGESKRELMQSWEERSDDLINSFAELFGTEGKFYQMWKEGTGRLRLAEPPVVGSARAELPPDEIRSSSPVMLNDLQKGGKNCRERDCLSDAEDNLYLSST